jgi:hypothetical protein
MTLHVSLAGGIRWYGGDGNVCLHDWRDGVKAKEQAIEELRFKKGVHIDIHPLPFRDLSETNASPYRQSRPLTSRESSIATSFSMDGRFHCRGLGLKSRK